jgi:phosphatidylglycerol lysyltransferase
LLAALRAHGRNATSFQLLESDFRIREDVGEEGFIGYVDTGGAWIAGGEPIAGPAHIVEVATRFLDAARHTGRRAAFFATEGQLAHLPATRRLLLGRQPVWDPVAWPQTLADSRSLRAQLRRARAHGVSVRQVATEEVAVGSPLRTQLDALIRRWQMRRPIAEMGFLVRLEPFAYADERLLFVAERAGAPVAVLSMAPVFGRGGWLFEDLLREADAPNGTTELLVDAGMRAIAARGDRWATLGLAPLAGPVPSWLQRVRRVATPFFNFEGLAAFKARLRPSHWDDIWLVHPVDTSPVRALLDALTAFAGGSLLRFGWRTLRRGPPPVLALMAALLVPWTIVLALLDTSRWYPAPWMQLGWVAFDIVLSGLLAELSRRWHHALGVFTALLITLDDVVTSAQAVTWYAPRVASAWDALWLLIATTAPTLASIVVWGAVARRTAPRA